MSTLTEAKISEQLRLLVKIYLINGMKQPSSLYGANVQWKIHISR